MRWGEAAKGIASFAAAATNIVQASELVDDLTKDANHFTGPRWVKVLFWLTLVLLAAQEVKKARHRFERVMS